MSRRLLLVLGLAGAAPALAQVTPHLPPQPVPRVQPPSPLEAQRERQRQADYARQRSQLELLRQERAVDGLHAQNADRTLRLRQATTVEPLVADRLQREGAAREAERRLERARRARVLQAEIDAAQAPAAHTFQAVPPPSTDPEP